jgi:serine protease Do
MKKPVIIILAMVLVIQLQAQDLSKLYQKVNPAVVTITVEEREVITDRTTMSKAVVTNEGLGSGVVISETGEIMTAAHVVEAAENVTVSFVNGDKVPAKVVTLNADADVALVKLVWIPKDMKTVPIGNSDDVKIGNQVFVIGAPLGLEHSLSVGHISGRMADTEISDKFSRPEFFQTDASINHGNSGGPMFNMKGEVIGIVSFILSQSGGFEGIGFAATSNVAKHELLGDQPFWFGLTHQPLVGPAAAVFNLPQEMGLLVQKVATNSPADLAGIRPGVFNVNIEGNEFLAGGDIVLQVDKFVIEPKINIVEFRQSMANKKPGESIPVKVLRGGQLIDLIIIVPE